MFFWKTTCVLTALLMSLVGVAAHAQESTPLRVLSPGGVLEVVVTLEQGAPHYAVNRFGEPVVLPSRLGFELRGAGALRENFTVQNSARRSVDETWEQPWGEKKTIRNHFNELRVELVEATAPARRMTLVFRSYDDGVGFRYELPEQEHLDALQIEEELTEFTFTGDHRSWWVEAYQRDRYEYPYEDGALSAVKAAHTPLTMRTRDGLHISIHEAALVDFASMTLVRANKNQVRAGLVPWSDGVKVRGAVPMKSPWRTLQISDTAGGLITSYLILNLNEPNKLADVSWIEPGKYVGIWWTMHLSESTWGSGPKHGATTQEAKRYMDFAAKHGFKGVLIEGWNTGWDGDWMQNGDIFSFTTPYPDFDIEEVARYASKRGVRLIGHHETSGAIQNYERQMADAFAYYQKLGVRAVKTGYVVSGQGIRRPSENGEPLEWHHGQFMVRHYQKVLEEAAKYKISINTHEPIKDTGLRRTWPNAMTREGARGQEYNAWSDGNPPEHTVILPFTRMLSGPMDFTPGVLDLTFDGADSKHRIRTTLAKQLALYVALYSPLQMAADLPENYEAKPEAFQFIVDVPADWEDTRVLGAEIGDYLSIVRRDRDSDDWYLGALSDEHGRLLEAPLSFLDPGRTYRAEIYRDGPGAHWRTNPYEMEIEEMLVTSETVLSLRLAAGGGQAVRFTPVRGWRRR